MAKRIITISREFGSGGRFIGEKSQKNSELLIIMIQRRNPRPFARTSEG